MQRLSGYIAGSVSVQRRWTRYLIHNDLRNGIRPRKYACWSSHMHRWLPLGQMKLVAFGIIFAIFTMSSGSISSYFAPIVSTRVLISCSRFEWRHCLWRVGQQCTDGWNDLSIHVCDPND